MKSTLTHRLQQMTASLYGQSVSAHVGKPPFYLVPDFFATADTLWSQFEQQISDSVELNDGLTPLLYAFGEGTYQFLTVSADRVFSRDALDEVTKTLRMWAKEQLGTSFVSTPQVRVYIDGCKRDFLTDRTEAQWHYMASLNRNSGKDGSPIRLAAESVRSRLGERGFSLESVLNLQLRFNQLLVHNAESPYGIGPTKASSNPVKGSVFLDGYLW
jgi:hypothetical protein